jgi:predicted glycosyltransferase
MGLKEADVMDELTKPLEEQMATTIIIGLETILDTIAKFEQREEQKVIRDVLKAGYDQGINVLRQKGLITIAEDYERFWREAGE